MPTDGGSSEPRGVDVGASAGSRHPQPKLDRLLLRLPLGVIGVERSGRVCFANARARHLLRPADLEPGRPLPEPWPELPLRPLVDRLYEYGASLPPRTVALDGGAVVQIAGAAGDDDEPAVLLLHDVTPDYRQTHAESEFARNAAHQLRTPVAGIAGAVEALQSGAKETPEERDRFLAHIERETARLGRVIRSLLVLARAHAGAQPPQLEFVTVRPILDEVAASLELQAAVRIEVEAPSALAALCERDLLHEALAALGENAARRTHQGSIALRAREGDDHVLEIVVADSGEGILPEHLDLIFRPFYQPTPNGEGFGLGLAIARRAVEAMGGQLDVRSVPGVGSRFLLRLPSARLIAG